MKKIFLSLLATLLVSLTGSAQAQTIDVRIGLAMNTSDYFGLYDIYHSAPKDSIDTFLEVLSRCMLGNRFNRPDISIPAFDELLKTQSENLDLNLLLNCSVMYSMDLSRVGKNQEAYDLMSSVLNTAYQVVDTIRLSSFADMMQRYKALTNYTPYQTTISGDTGKIPFNIVELGDKDSHKYHMQIAQSEINGKPATITFDTGAGANAVSDSLAKAYGLEFLDANVSAAGAATSVGRYAIARELKIGNITVRDVPFYVLDLSSGSEKADKILNQIQFIVGCELMLQLKDLTIDFTNNEIQVSKDIAEPADIKPNICFSSGMLLHTTAEVMGQPVLFSLDSGDADYGLLNKNFYTANKEYIDANCRQETRNTAGAGGV